ncbi:RagB/SusD family nutrient uptake outer membrane protein [Mucilaginibacter sp. L3T2-6]|uniref:RagB/SusD family nutrient uptake outer membrane protein n=1 Tax=Mucilaginibacter sp. L3T2-6 TaxID=3062491 RepID=UPI0026748E48|nr:RagB/SusD family nutrient uptake outer membrane protein [Mucilaginibacter sp. L3T2-6]MDO3641255.1 RagB/SusD family nutrient uptake outer membrane protein [Mucilaginibacter sp. L3T2-6]MDV6213985.1 RagB/SusD family nutrient uptake outer membrane protein [Mucilaginibacter sp. L3T2-6]
MKKLLYILLLGLLTSCTKTFLDKKPDQTLVVPQTFQDLQALLDNANTMNLNLPALGEVSSDDYYVTDAAFASVTTPMFRNAYTWNKDLYEGSPDVIDWNYCYQQVFYSNVVLEGLAKMSATQRADPRYAAEKGSALFFRAYGLYAAAQLFCKPYHASTAATDLGMPVRTSSDITQKSTRASVKATYGQVTADLQESLGYLPQTVSIKTRPSLAAGNGLLARVYLSMADYPHAFQYADQALKLYSTLLDYNTASTAKLHPFRKYNDEVIFHSRIYYTSLTNNTSRLRIDTSLYALYQPDDLRKVLFFTPAAPGQTFKGSYTGTDDLFNGVATDELYLIRAEASARMGQKDAAMADLQTLLDKRYRTGTYSPPAAATAAEVLELVLAERRKELLLRGLRWSDLRRFNEEPGREVTLQRQLNGQLYTLPPNDPRYVLPIPDIVIQLSGIPQNPR